MLDQLEKGLKLREPQPPEVSALVAYTRYWPLTIVTLKSLSDAQPDLGCAKAAVEFHLGDAGRLHAMARLTMDARTVLKSFIVNLKLAFVQVGLMLDTSQGLYVQTRLTHSPR
jgi:hypothetical protein